MILMVRKSVFGNRFRVPVVLIALLAVVTFLRREYDWTLVVGDSMKPRFETGDLVVVDKTAYEQAEPERGDLVVARWRGDLLIKRVVGLPDEEVEIVEGELWINGHVIPEEYVTRKGSLHVGKGLITGHRFALFGDNRDPEVRVGVAAVVPKSQIVGKVVFSIRLIPGRRGSET